MVSQEACKPFRCSNGNPRGQSSFLALQKTDAYRSVWSPREEDSLRTRFSQISAFLNSSTFTWHESTQNKLRREALEAAKRRLNSCLASSLKKVCNCFQNCDAHSAFCFMLDTSSVYFYQTAILKLLIVKSNQYSEHDFLQYDPVVAYLLGWYQICRTDIKYCFECPWRSQLTCRTWAVWDLIITADPDATKSLLTK